MGLLDGQAWEKDHPPKNEIGKTVSHIANFEDRIVDNFDRYIEDKRGSLLSPEEWHLIEEFLIMMNKFYSIKPKSDRP
jgi:hypothetical protein